jgi:hypothetical protein
MKVLFLMAFPGYLRYFDSVVRVLADRGHTVVLAFNVPFKEIDGMEALADAPGDIRWLEQVPLHDAVWQGVSAAVRRAADYSRYLHPRYASSHFLRDRIRQLLAFPFRFLGRLQSLGAARADRLTQLLLDLEHAVPVSHRIQAFIRALGVDVVVLTPLVTDGSPQVDWVKAARRAGRPCMLSVASWDHLTSKGLMRVMPDVVTVWNHTQRSEAVELHAVPSDRVVVTGAVPWDRWFHRAPRLSRADFYARVGLDDQRPFVLFVGSSASISSPQAEVAFVRQWVQCLRDSQYHELRNCGVLIRPHPYNSAHWEDVTFTGVNHVAVFPRHGSSPARASDRADFFDTLYHSTAVVGLNTSAMIEAAIVGRPVLTILSADFTTTQTGTLHFRYLLPDRGGFIRAATTFEEHVEHLVSAFRGCDPERARAEEFVGTFVRPLGRDVSAAAVVADTVERLACQRPHEVPRAPAWMTAARCALWCIGFVSAMQDPIRRRRLRREVLSGSNGVKRKALKELDYHAARVIYGAARKRRKRRDAHV